MADRTMLQFDWEEIRERPITAVMGLDWSAGRFEAIAFVLTDRAAVLRVDQDTDEIEVQLENLLVREANWERVDCLSNLIGFYLGWSWIGRNYLGYLDTFTIGFAEREPGATLTQRICFVGDASALSMYRMSEIHELRPAVGGKLSPED